MNIKAFTLKTYALTGALAWASVTAFAAPTTTAADPAPTTSATTPTTTMTSAAAPSAESLEKLAKIVPYEEIYMNAAIEPFLHQGMHLMTAMTNDSKLTDDQRKKAREVYEKYLDGLTATVKNAAVKKNLKSHYINAAKQYTQAEVDALIAFYGSDAGKKAIEREEKVMDSYLKAIAPETVSILENYDKANRVKTEDAIKRILDK